MVFLDPNTTFLQPQLCLSQEQVGWAATLGVWQEAEPFGHKWYPLPNGFIPSDPIKVVLQLVAVSVTLCFLVCKMGIMTVIIFKSSKSLLSA